MATRRAWRVGAIRHDLVTIRRFTDTVRDKSRVLESEVEQAHDAGILSLRSNTGGGIPPKGTVSRLTETSAGSYEYHRLASVNQYVANKVAKALKDSSSASRHLEDAYAAIHEAWLDTDPDLGPDRRARRKAATEAG